MNTNVGREVVFRPTIGRHNILDMCDDNGGPLVNLTALLKARVYHQTAVAVTTLRAAISNVKKQQSDTKNI